MRRSAGAALAVAAAAGGVTLGGVVVPRPTAHLQPAAAHRVELRALYGPAGSLVDVRRIETWRFGDRERRRETRLGTGGAPVDTIRAGGRVTIWDARLGASRPRVVRDRVGAFLDDVDRRAVRLRSAFELGWMQRVGEVRVARAPALVLRARPSSPIERGWIVAVDPDTFAPLAGERRARGRLVERRRLLVDERVPLRRAALDRSSLSRARSVRPQEGRPQNPDHDTRSTMTNRATVTRALAALSVAAAVAGGQAATATAAPKRATIRHWVIETKTMSGKVGRTVGWQRAGDRHVVDGDPVGPGFPWCEGSPDWRLHANALTVCGRPVQRRGSGRGPGPRQMMNPTELGQLVRESIDRGGYEAAGEDVVGGRRVTVWREADRSGFEPEEERKLGFSTYYLDATDDSFVAERHDDIASGKAQELRVLVDQALPATTARLARAGLGRGHSRSGKTTP